MIYIGEASKLSGASIKAIRHYEKMGLLPDIVRSGSYRTFTENDIGLIKFIKEAQNVGFKLAEFKQAFKSNEGWSWEEVEKLVRQKEQEISKEIETLKIKQAQLNEYSCLIIECIEAGLSSSQTPVEYMFDSPLRE